ncbi:MAG: hypothetical protein EBR29_00125 [Sphingobacteriia bacterium]|nr:hypothetical protein [Sphingobacteriia bacterium]
MVNHAHPAKIANPPRTTESQTESKGAHDHCTAHRALEEGSTNHQASAGTNKTQTHWVEEDNQVETMTLGC